jgi:hypothetical protein
MTWRGLFSGVTQTENLDEYISLHGERGCFSAWIDAVTDGLGDDECGVNYGSSKCRTSFAPHSQQSPKADNP